MADAQRVMGWLGFAFNVIVANLIAHGLWSVYGKRNLIQWSARHFDQLFYAILAGVVFVLIECNIQLLGGILGYFVMPYALQWFLNNFFGISFWSLCLLRAWLVHYDFHSGVAIANLVTNSKLEDDQREHLEWFLHNKSNYGSPKYMTKFTIYMIIIINLFMLGWSLISEQTFPYAMIFFYAVLVLVSIGVTRHITLLDDNFFVRQELLIQFRMFAAMFIVGGILIIFGPGMGWIWAGYFLIELSVLTVLGMCFVSTYWVMRKTYSVGLDSVTGNLPNIEPPTGSPPLSVALRDTKATRQFLRHLVNEISVENIFYLADVMAFKKSFIKNNKLRSLGNGFRCEVPESLSRLIFRRTFTHYAWAISKTYIDGSSSFYVTAIGDTNREDVIDKLELLEPDHEKQGADVAWFEELQNIFDECSNDVYIQLKKSYARFSYTPQFQRITKNIRANQMVIPTTR